MKERILFWGYDLDSTSYKYGKFDEFWSPGEGLLSTAGSSTTVTADTAGAFKDVKVGDLLRVLSSAYASGGPSFSTVKITAKASNTSITVSSALNLTAAGPWQYLVAEVPDTAATAGWFNVGGFKSMTIHPTITTVAAAGGIDLTVESKGPAGFISTLYSVNYATATAELPIPVGEDVQMLRVGVKGGSGFAGTDVIDIVFNGRLRA